MPHDTTRPSGSAPQPGARPLSETVAQSAPPTASKVPTRASTPAQYELGEEFASGGMGVLYRARDLTFGRTVALKVMRAGMSGEEFAREAQVTARLPHPGIPPVYALGTLPDGRPFLAMKFVNGNTLDAVLKAHTADRGRLLAAFERVCETVGFAHARHVVHRDLKPANLMLGEAGEVFVMDWGLATRAAAADASASASLPVELSSAVAQSVAKGVKGTPAYMAPEQARDEPVDERADVFALGGILCAILTGKPPIEGDTVLAAVLNAAAGALGSAFARLDTCGADAELVALAKRCLAPARDARPANGSEVARLVADYRAGIEARVRRAETERAAAEARAAEEANTRAEAEARAAAEQAARYEADARAAAEETARFEAEEHLREQRKRRRTQLWLVGSVAVVLVLVAGATAGFVWVRGERRAEEAKLAGERDAEARNKAEQTRKGIDESFQLATELKKKYQFKQADAALVRAEQLAITGAPDRAAEIKLARRDLALAVKLDELHFSDWMRPNWEGKSGELEVRDYLSVLREYGINPTGSNVAETAKRIATSFARTELVGALDRAALHETNRSALERLLDVARRVSPNPWTDRLRDTAVRGDATALRRLASEVDLARAPASALTALAQLLARARVSPVPFLTAARHERPDDYELAVAHAIALHLKKDLRSLGAWEAAVALRPTGASAWVNLGEARKLHGDLPGAAVAYRRALELVPGRAPVHSNLGIVLADMDNFPQAVVECQRAIDIEPGNAMFRTHLGCVYHQMGENRRAIREHLRAIELDKDHAQAHYNLGLAQMDDEQFEEALRTYKRADELAPEWTGSNVNSAIICVRLGRFKEALAHAEAALKVDPQSANAHFGRGRALRALGDEPGALRAFAEAKKINPKLPPNGPPTDKKP